MTEPAETNEAQNPLTKPKFIISAVVVALLVALGLIFALTPREGGTATPTTAPNNSPSATSSQSSTSSSASVCGLPAGDQSKPAGPPADTKWELVGKFAAPTSPQQYGPGQTAANGLRSCFAHSPTGALYAGSNLIILGSSGRSGILAQHLVAEGPERNEMLNAADTATPPQTSGPAPFQLAGFKITDYTGDRAVIDYGVTAANGSVGSFSIVMQWQDGDWKWAPPTTGHPESRQLSDLNGFISWAGV